MAQWGSGVADSFGRAVRPAMQGTNDFDGVCSDGVEYLVMAHDKVPDVGINLVSIKRRATVEPILERPRSSLFV